MMKMAMLLMAALLVGSLMMTGCQSAGQVVSSKPLVTCPDCKMEVVTSRIKGLDFTRVVCPMCGKVWVPSRDPKKYPVCPECKEIYESLPPGDDGDGAAE